MQNRVATVIFGAWCVVAAGVTSAASSYSSASLDTTFVAIDQTGITYPSKSLGVEPSPFIVWKQIFPLRYISWIMTLNHATGAQLGDRLEVSLPVAVVPVDIMWSDYFSSSPKRGVEPSPFVLARDFTLYAFPVTYAIDGTPKAGIMAEKPIPADPGNYGYPTCFMELPGTLFQDLKPRMYVGTELGYVIAVVEGINGMQVEGSFFLPAPVVIPIRDLEPIPQYGYIAVGVLRGNFICGLSPVFTQKGDGRIESQAVMFTLQVPGAALPIDFDVFGPDDQLLPRPDTTVRLILANGTADLALADVSASQTGAAILSPTIDTQPDAVRSVVTGSLLLLAEDGAGVYYDPGYSEDSGSSGCDVNITDGRPDICAATCGDANGDGTVNVGDVVFLVSYVFKGGGPPSPVCIGDANGDGSTNVGDAVYLISYVFKGGAPPVETCCP